MIWIAAAAGAAAGAAIIALMHREGMLRERSGLAMLLAAIAFFYPVFAAAEADWGAVALHGAIFVGFVALAVRAWRRGTFLIAGGLIAHGLFDIAAGVIGAPGPTWWPAFCGALDIVAGVAVLRLIQTGKIAE